MTTYKITYQDRFGGEHVARRRGFSAEAVEMKFAQSNPGVKIICVVAE